MRLRKPCYHDRYETHPIEDMEGHFACPGGQFLPADALVVEKVDGEWPEWASSQSPFRTQIMGDGYPSLFPRTMAEILDALVQASQVGETE